MSREPINNRRKRLNQAPRKIYRCLITPESGPCLHCQTVVDLYEEALPLLKNITNRRLQDPDQSEDYVHEFYHKNLRKRTHSFQIEDPTFNQVQYMITMLYNFIYDERGRRIRQSIIDGLVVGLTRESDDLITPDLVVRQVEARSKLREVASILRKQDLDLITKVLDPEWNIVEEAKRNQVQTSAIRARINRVRAKLRDLA